jgi:hypothetical protein
MADKGQKRGNKEVRKPKQAKGPGPAAASPFVVTAGKTPAGGVKKK